jgi:hypothetical protein
MMENGYYVESMEGAQTSLLTGTFIMGNIKMEDQMDKDHINGKVEVATKVDLLRDLNMGKAHGERTRTI